MWPHDKLLQCPSSSKQIKKQQPDLSLAVWIDSSRLLFLFPLFS